MKYIINKSLWAGATLLMLSSCGTVFEDGDLCPPAPAGPTYQVRFDDSRNMNFADAFASEVQSVTLFVLDSQSKDVVKVISDDNQKNLQSGNYTMNLDVEPGTYDLVAWCGLAETEEAKPSFSLTGETKTIEDLSVKLNESQQTLSSHLSELHNGVLMRQTLTANDTTLVVPLTRNTNNVRVVLQRIDGTNLNADDFSFSITADNGLMKYDNSLLKDTEHVYTEYDKRNDASTSGGTAVIGEVSTARMVKGENMRLRAMYKDRTLLNIPLINYALMVKSYNEKPMSDQEFLDRQNDWNFIFFLNDQNQWEHSNVVVNDWHLVLDNIEL